MTDETTPVRHSGKGYVYGELRTLRNTRLARKRTETQMDLHNKGRFNVRMFGVPLSDAVSIEARDFDHAAELLAHRLMQSSTCPDCAIRIVSMDNKKQWTFEQGELIRKTDRDYTGGSYVDV